MGNTKQKNVGATSLKLFLLFLQFKQLLTQFSYIGSNDNTAVCNFCPTEMRLTKPILA